LTDRKDNSYEGRIQAAKIARDRPIENNKSNGEENKYKDGNGKLNYIANFTKGLKHHEKSHPDAGEVISEDYRDLRDAIQSEDPTELDNIKLGDEQPFRKLTNPEAAFAFDLEGPDSHDLAIKPAPTLDNDEASGEMAELYWMAYCRDVPFEKFSQDSRIQEAVEDLKNNYGEFPVVPKSVDKDCKFPQVTVTNETVFRGMTEGDLKGGYISQFLLQDIHWGPQQLEQKQRILKNVDYLTDYDTWLKIQNGFNPSKKDDPEMGRMFVYEDSKEPLEKQMRRHIATPRDLSYYVHIDQLYQAYLGACLILLNKGYPFDNSMPLKDSKNTFGFGTFGGPHILSLVTEVATRALKAVWYQKWGVHRRLRPEAFGGLIHRQKNADKHVDPDLTSPNPRYPINEKILNSKVLERIFEHNKKQNDEQNRNSDGTYLLPMAFHEGSPTHPSYGAGHATVAGACTTILKAWFDESATMKEEYYVREIEGGKKYELTKKENPEGLTVGGELNKVAANIAIGRNWAGVHYRSDYTESLLLGEKVAIGVLQENALCYEMDPKNPKGYFKCNLTKFDSCRIKFNGSKIETV
jgi:hypothetical protein